ncbi:hypothetical protein OE88DRAFT_1292850 [Heliocybe sulcata]|uniref:Fungal-type protein kinase domain-containing protein n=1 Tax=Heliocybe sulcata TaxID=5364 RepID=A0A5C3N607_9AGAM|nr:hypothetical protein OE88DRAFT_1292850 [Heliocybe sulcata]
MSQRSTETRSSSTLSCISTSASSSSSCSQPPTSKQNTDSYRMHAGKEAATNAAGPFNVDEFLEQCFPGTDRKAFRSIFDSRKRKNFEELLREAKKGRKHKSEKAMHAPTMKALQYAYDVLAGDGHLTELRIDNTSQQKLSGDAEEHKPAPDLAVQLKASPEKRWTHALAIVDIKPDTSKDTPRRDNEPVDVEAPDQIHDYATLAFQSRPRCYLLGFALHGHISRFYRWDHSCVIYSAWFNWKCQPDIVLEFLYASSVFSNRTMGIDSTVVPGISDIAEGPLLANAYRFARDLGILDGQKALDLTSLVVQSSAIVVPAGHDDASQIDKVLHAYGTNHSERAASPAREAKHTSSSDAQVASETAVGDERGDEPRDLSLVTVSRKHSSRCEARSKPSTHIYPTSGQNTTERFISLGTALFTSSSLFGRGTRTWLAVQDTVQSSSRSIGTHDLVVIKDSWRDADRFSESAIYSKIHQAGHTFGVARVRRGVDLDGGERHSVHRTWAEKLNAFREVDRYTHRIHHRIIIESIGIPLSQFRSTRELVQATKDAMEGHRHLYEKLQILHRDISVNNIMISVASQAEGGAKGFLIDLDYAVFVNDTRATSELQELTGTADFIAVELQLGNYIGNHQPYHDLESFYWSLLYTTLRHTRTNRGPLYCDSIFSARSGLGKLGFLSPLAQAALSVDNNPRLTACLTSFGRLTWESVQIGVRITHSAAMNCLDAELKKPGWLEGDRALPLEACSKQQISDAVGENNFSKEMHASGLARRASLKRKPGDGEGEGQEEEVKARQQPRQRRA